MTTIPTISKTARMARAVGSNLKRRPDIPPPRANGTLPFMEDVEAAVAEAVSACIIMHACFTHYNVYDREPGACTMLSAESLTGSTGMEDYLQGPKSSVILPEHVAISGLQFELFILKFVLHPSKIKPT